MALLEKFEEVSEEMTAKVFVETFAKVFESHPSSLPFPVSSQDLQATQMVGLAAPQRA